MSETGFPEPNKSDNSCLDLARKLPFEEEISGSSRCPPRAKLVCFRADRFLPSEQRGSRRDMVLWTGGLLSSTIKIERSIGADERVVTCKGRLSAGLSMGLSSREIVGGFSRKESLGAGGSVGSSLIEISDGFSCKRESDNGGGVVRSSENAAQSQWVDRAPQEFQYWCAAT